MKKAISLCICVLIFLGSLIPNSDYEELFKVNELLKHYKEHKEGNSKLSFIDFLAEHYTENSTHKNAPEHSKLPFFHHDFANFVFILSNNLCYSLVKEKVDLISYTPFFCKYIFSVSTNPFRPPQS